VFCLEEYLVAAIANHGLVVLVIPELRLPAIIAIAAIVVAIAIVAAVAPVMLLLAAGT